jgi:hypothetical protein
LENVQDVIKAVRWVVLHAGGKVCFRFREFSWTLSWLPKFSDQL